MRLDQKQELIGRVDDKRSRGLRSGVLDFLPLKLRLGLAVPLRRGRACDRGDGLRLLRGGAGQQRFDEAAAVSSASRRRRRRSLGGAFGRLRRRGHEDDNAIVGGQSRGGGGAKKSRKAKCGEAAHACLRVKAVGDLNSASLCLARIVFI
jgi:hypothetical protein